MHLSIELSWIVLAIGVALTFASAVVSMVMSHRANQRAETLLRRMLTSDELDQLNRVAYIDVPSPNHVDRVYRVPAWWGTIAVLEKGVVVKHLCVRPVQALPSREHVLAHKVFIEANEAEYLRRANVTWARQPLPAQIGG